MLQKVHWDQGQRFFLCLLYQNQPENILFFSVFVRYLHLTYMVQKKGAYVTNTQQTIFMEDEEAHRETEAKHIYA